MKPEEYIEKLKEAQRTLDSAKEGLDRSIYKMERRLETGYENLEQDGRLAALSVRLTLMMLAENIYTIGTAKIEY